jgi:DNA-binding CsgD family transcriptional regulator
LFAGIAYRDGMTGKWRLDYCQRAIAQLPRDGVPWEVLSGEIVRHVRRAVGFDSWCLSLTDPVTALPTAVVGTQGSPVASCQRRFWQLEYLVPDVCKASALAASALPVAALSHETGGDLARSQRWDELLRPAGAADELRAVLNADGAPWGSLALYRAGRPGAGNQFSADDIRAVETMRGALTDAARAGWATIPPAVDGGSDGAPATLVATMDGTLTDATPTAEARLARMGLHRQAGYTLIYALLAKLAADMNHDDYGERAGDRVAVSVVTRTADGRWAEVHAAPLVGCSRLGGNGHAAITIRSAPAPRVRSVLLRALSLSGRERQVAALAADGMSAKDIAATLYISTHTARDHLKVIFRKTRSHTRRELAARLAGSTP